MNTIALHQLTKYYSGSKIAAVNNVSLSIKAGEVYGFLGSNGAGKSTTIRLLMDFLRPTSGSVKLLGKDSVLDSLEIKESVGYLAGDVALPRKVTGRQLLTYLARLHGTVDPAYLIDLEARFEAQLDKKTDTLSKGNRQKIGIIQAFMHQPSVLILDEPTSGLDPLMQEQFYKLVEEAKARGASVFLSSHSFSEVERICDRIGIIRQGKLVHEGPVAKLMQHRLPTWHVTVTKKSDIEVLRRSKLLTVVSSHDKTLTVRPVESISSAFAVLSKVEVVAMTVEQVELEDEFMSFYNQGQTT
jgi:ABC-2 type transport system ATP-binding protein